MRIALALLLGAALASAQPNSTAQPNTLTRQEIDEGWILLWDGQTDYGWEWHGDAEWTFRDGVLRAGRGGYGWLGTKASFGDFRLKLEFRCAADGNSGVFLRSAREGQPHRTGYELQIYDDQPQGFNTGSLVFYEKAAPAKLIPNAWNQFDILVEGTRYRVELNGKVVLDTHNASHTAGVIGLQFNPDKPIDFRSIKLRPLGMEPLFDGRSLAGWRKVDRPERPGDHLWSVREGAIHVEGGPGHLETEKQFQNFVLQLAVKTNPPSPDRHPNSGVFFRAWPGKFWDGYESQIRNEFAARPDDPVDFGTGGVYLHQRARRIVARDGERFVKTIVAYDKHIAVWVDGVQVSDYQDTKPDGENARMQANTRRGVISLQAHDPTTNLDFGDIRAAEIPERPLRLQSNRLR